MEGKEMIAVCRTIFVWRYLYDGVLRAPTALEVAAHIMSSPALLVMGVGSGHTYLHIVCHFHLQ